MTDSLLNSSSTESSNVDQDQENLDSFRVQENEEISGQFRSHLDRRGQRSNFSPSFLNSQPKSALEKFHVTTEQEEQILYLYAATYSLHQTAASSGVSLDKVRAIVYSPLSTEKINHYREEMKISVLQKIEEAQIVLLDSLQEPEKLKASSITQISEVFVEISGTQANLISTLREAYSPTSDMDPGEFFTGEELEYMKMLRRRLDIGHSAIPEEIDLDAPLDPIETDFVVSEDSAGFEDDTDTVDEVEDE